MVTCHVAIFETCRHTENLDYSSNINCWWSHESNTHCTGKLGFETYLATASDLTRRSGID